MFFYDAVSHVPQFPVDHRRPIFNPSLQGGIAEYFSGVFIPFLIKIFLPSIIFQIPHI